jgi:hypothetical protein
MTYRDLTSFPTNEMGEPLMDATAWRFEQALDAESADDPGDYYDRMDQYDESDDPDYCDYHDTIHRTSHAKTQCAAEQTENIDPHDGFIYPPD